MAKEKDTARQEKSPSITNKTHARGVRFSGKERPESFQGTSEVGQGGKRREKTRDEEAEASRVM